MGLGKKFKSLNFKERFSGVKESVVSNVTSKFSVAADRKSDSSVSYDVFASRWDLRNMPAPKTYYTNIYNLLFNCQYSVVSQMDLITRMIKKNTFILKNLPITEKKRIGLIKQTRAYKAELKELKKQADQYHQDILEITELIDSYSEDEGYAYVATCDDINAVFSCNCNAVGSDETEFESVEDFDSANFERADYELSEDGSLLVSTVSSIVKEDTEVEPGFEKVSDNVVSEPKAAKSSRRTRSKSGKIEKS